MAPITSTTSTTQIIPEEDLYHLNDGIVGDLLEDGDGIAQTPPAPPAAPSPVAPTPSWADYWSGAEAAFLTHVEEYFEGYPYGKQKISNGLSDDSIKDEDKFTLELRLTVSADGKPVYDDSANPVEIILKEPDGTEVKTYNISDDSVRNADEIKFVLTDLVRRFEWPSGFPSSDSVTGRQISMSVPKP